MLRATRFCQGLVLLTLATAALFSASASAQERGFRVNRYEGSVAGSETFLVDRPWYTSVRHFSIGVTGDYARNPLRSPYTVGGTSFAPLISNAVTGHLDIAGALFDRLLVSASLPVTLLETGTPEALSGVTPLQAVGIGDPRIGVMVRIAGQPDTDPFSLHFAADGWVPIGGAATHQGDTGVRLEARAILSGTLAQVVRWSFEGGFHYRPYASLGPPALGMIAGSEARVGASLGLALANKRIIIGPEARFSSQVAGDAAWVPTGMNLEVLGGAQFLIASHLQVGIAGGTAFLGAAGTPDIRAMVRLAWAPREPIHKEDEEARQQENEKRAAKKAFDAADPDDDGVPTVDDRCPYEPESKNGVRDQDGCPEYDGVGTAALARVLAPRPVAPAAAPMVDAGSPASVTPRVLDAGVPPVAAVPAPLENSLTVDAGVDRAALFTTMDSDGDGIADEADRCPVQPEDPDEFEDEDGCPELDNDGDGILDVGDLCNDQAETANGVEDNDGCPDRAPDADEDGVADAVDRCPFERETRNGVRDEDGCPEYQAAENAALSSLLAKVDRAFAPAAPQALGEPTPEFGTADSDKDGIRDEDDRCPVTPEDLDAFEDEDGCPEDDNDSDGIEDSKDKCPDSAEVFNGFEDEDGCPDAQPDVDGDTFDYSHDRCPLEPGIAPDGCPHAPLPPLAIAGFAGAPVAPAVTAEPGAAVAPAAPAADYDKDGIVDEEDPCPMSAEDLDGFEDEDGCPERDNDQDGIEDAKDKCVLVAETINGIADTDGCPDQGESAVTVEKEAVVIKGIIQFKTGSADLQPASMPLVQQVASTLRAASTLSIEIQGHTDDVGNAATNVKLSKRRAETIRTILIKAGVAATRLVANGYGPTRPRATNKTQAGRLQNRRVEFLILGESK